jgi:hypothetical protein
MKPWWFLFLLILVALMAITLGWISFLQTTKSLSEKPVWVSMTTIPERLRSKMFQRVIETILAQRPDRLLLNIPYIYNRTSEPYEIPDWIATRKRIQVVRCDDVGPLTKIMGGLAVLPDDVWVVVMDDDQIYKSNCISDLRQQMAQSSDNRTVWCSNVFAEERWVQRGAHFRFAKTMPCGYGGFIAHSEHIKRLHALPRFPQCFKIDDHWLGWAFHELGVTVQQLPHCSGSFHSLAENPNAPNHHPKWFELRLHTNRKRDQRICGDAIEEYWTSSQVSN